MRDLVIIGAGGFGSVVVDIAQKLNKYDNIYFLDDFATENPTGIKVVGKTSDSDKYIDSADFCVAIGNSEARSKLIESLLSKGANLPAFIHPNSVIGSFVKIGQGTVVMAGAVINPCVTIGKGVIVNTSCSIDHDCTVGDYVHVSVGARLAGTVSVGEHTWIAVGASVRNNVTICDNCMIGVGAAVVKDIVEQGVYVGVPAKRIDK